MISNACANSITSLPSADNWPLLGVDLSRNCFGPKPRKYGAMVQKPPVENKTVGIRIEDPAVDFASNAKSYGVWGAGPVTEPKDLAKALRDAIKVVKEGKPALVDVVVQMR